MEDYGPCAVWVPTGRLASDVLVEHPLSSTDKTDPAVVRTKRYAAGAVVKIMPAPLSNLAGRGPSRCRRSRVQARSHFHTRPAYADGVQIVCFWQTSLVVKPRTPGVVAGSIAPYNHMWQKGDLMLVHVVVAEQGKKLIPN